jgi:hypothetical protein
MKPINLMSLPVSKKRLNCRMRQPTDGPNKTEQEYMDQLKLLKISERIVDYGYEKIKLKLAKKTTYTPDFYVLHNDRSLDLIEIKGHWEDDARVKIKVAAEMFPFFRFIAVKKLTKKEGGGWKEEII